MPPDDRARTLAREWVAAADRQLELAETAFERRMWNEAVALSAGATERLLKAVLTSANQAFVYTHNFDRLLETQESDIREALANILTPRLRQQLTDGGTIARYPGGPSYLEDECRAAVTAGRSVRAALRSARPELFDD
ncbi:MAG: HEPN domain-containing protein [Acidobacteria bacterium]|nr:HEPN domain-containing protein [Acidobacteriota bacterium]